MKLNHSIIILLLDHYFKINGWINRGILGVLCLIWEEGMEWNGKKWKKIILEYSSLPLFKSFNGGNKKSIPLFGSLSGNEWNV